MYKSVLLGLFFALTSQFVLALDKSVVKPGKGKVLHRVVSLDDYGLQVDEAMQALEKRFMVDRFHKGDEAYKMTDFLLRNFQKYPPAGDIITSTESKRRYLVVRFNLNVDKNSLDETKAPDIETQKMKYEYRRYVHNSGSIRINLKYKYNFFLRTMIGLISSFGGGKQYMVPQESNLQVTPLKKQNAIRISVSLDPRIPVYKYLYDDFANSFLDSAIHTFEKFILPKI
jgi:hypothetical protein